MALEKLFAYKDGGILSGTFYKFFGEYGNDENYPIGIKNLINEGYEIIKFDQLNDKSTHVINHIHNDFLNQEQVKSWDN